MPPPFPGGHEVAVGVGQGLPENSVLLVLGSTPGTGEEILNCIECRVNRTPLLFRQRVLPAGGLVCLKNGNVSRHRDVIYAFLRQQTWQKGGNPGGLPECTYLCRGHPEAPR